MKELLTFYLPLTVLAGYAAMALFGVFGFWTVYLSLAIYGMYDYEQRFN